MVFGLGASELLIIGVILLLIFGAKRLPEIGRGLGKTAREIKDISKDLKGSRDNEKASGEAEEGQGGERGVPPDKDAVPTGREEGIPGLKEIKAVSETASQVRRWWWFLKH
ncbi:MAG: twin-arginine translocase TatA/TatE family subunit [Deltaproteobacteria bacterium]|nr:twin-arginine translocase TatA/TatE family subunit [Deltaproteobacteria bacterium]MBW2120922.1 twin-arginine translocase TatA/TatE family subunit [Deltaproteobacteria bacterium]